MRRAILAVDSNLSLYKSQDLKVGDLVVYRLQDHERRINNEESESLLIKFNAEWLLPVNVITVKENSIELKLETGKRILVPRRLIRKVGANVPVSLQKITTSIIERELPKVRNNPEWEIEKKRSKRPRIFIA